MNNNLSIKRIKNTVICLMIVSFLTVIFAESGGGMPFANMKIGVGSRGVGLGGAYQSLVNDGSSGYWNPAGYANVESKQFYTSYYQFAGQSAWQQEFQPTHLYFSYAHYPRNKWNLKIAYTLNYFGLNGFQHTNLNGDNDVELEGTEFSNTIFAVGIHTAGQTMSGLIDFGISMQFHNQTLEDMSAYGFSWSAGVQTNISEILTIDKILAFSNIRWGTVISIYTKEFWDRGNQDLITQPDISLAFSTDIKLQKSLVATIATGLIKRGVSAAQFRSGCEFKYLINQKNDKIFSKSVSVRFGAGEIYLSEVSSNEEIAIADMNKFRFHIPVGLGYDFSFNDNNGSINLCFDNTKLGGKLYIDINLDF